MAQGLLVFGPESIEFSTARAAELLEVPAEIVQAGKPWRDYFRYLRDRGDYGADVIGERRMADMVATIESGKRHRIERNALRAATC